MSPSTNTHYSSRDNITPSPEEPITSAPQPPFVSKYYFYNTLQAMFARFGQIFEKKNEIIEKQHEKQNQLKEKQHKE